MATALSPVQRTSSTLVLRPFKRRDVDGLLDAVRASLADLIEWLPWAHAGYQRSDAVAFVRESMAAWRDGRAFDFTIRRTDEPRRHLGNVSVWATTRAGQVGEVGYWVRSDETGKGVCTQASARILQIAFEELRMHKVVLRVAVGNIASERIAEKLGFSREGMLREELKVNGVWMDHSLWGLLRHEFNDALPGYRAEGWLE